MKRKQGVYFLFVTMMFIFFSFTTSTYAASPFAGGSGTAADPYMIADQTQLAAMNSYKTAYFKLANDITLTGYWTPIGTSSSPFQGNLNGNNRIIYNLNVSRNVEYSGLFAYARNVTISNLTLENGTINGTKDKSGSFIGHGDLNLTLNNCHSNLTVTGASKVGGLVGAAHNPRIENCSFYGKVTGTSYTGGIIGRAVSLNDGTSYISKTSVISADNSDTAIQVKGKTYTGGIAGQITGGIYQCYVGVNVEGDTQVGGIAGDLLYENKNTCTIMNCYSTGDVTARASDGIVGGIAGHTSMNSSIYYHSIERCYATGSIRNISTSAQFTGGIVGSHGILEDESNTHVGNSFALNSMVSQAKAYASAAKIGRISGRHYLPNTNFAVDTLKMYQGATEVTDFSNNTYAVHGITITTEQSQTQATYENAGWDFNAVWKMDTTVSPYPILRNVRLSMDTEIKPVEFMADGKKVISTIRMYVGQEISLSADNGMGYHPLVYVTVSDPAVLKIDPDGAVVSNVSIIGTKVGTTELTVAAFGSGMNVVGSRRIKVQVMENDITFSSSTDIDNNKIYINPDETIQLQAIPDFSGDPIERWEYVEKDVVEVTEDNTYKTLEITGKKTDPDGIDFKAVTKDGVQKIITVIVTEDKVVKQLVIQLETGMKLNLVGLYNTETVPMNNFQWTSDKPDVISVDNQGAIETITPGVATITAASPDGAIKKKITIAVISASNSDQDEEDSTVKFNTANLSFDNSNRLPINSTQNFTPVIINPSNRAVTFISSNPAVAAVNTQTGEITILGNGSSTITIVDENNNTLDTLDIQGIISLSTLEITAPAVKLKEGEKMTLSAVKDPVDADAEIRWHVFSLNQAASISESGELSAESTGFALVFAVADGIMSNVLAVEIEEASPNLISGQTVTASATTSSSGNPPSNAVDGNPDLRWGAQNGTDGINGVQAVLEIELEKMTKMNQIWLDEFADRVSGFKLEYYNGTDWVECYTGTTIGRNFIAEFDEIETNKIRFVVTGLKGLYGASLYEIEIHNTNQP